MKTENKYFYIDQPHDLSLRERIKSLIYPFYNLFLKAISLAFTKDKRETKYQISICSCFKNEAPFLKEWIEYHVFIGFNHFYLYNNNSIDNYKEVLNPYIKKGLITLVDLPDVPVQIPSYRHFVCNFKDETKWVAFIDLDEFVCPIKDDNIQNWLIKHDKYPVICMYWKYFGSSGLFNHDFNKTVIEQYTQATDKYINIGKCFYNTRYEIASFNTGMIHFLHTRWNMLTIPPVNESHNFVKWGINKMGGVSSRYSLITIGVRHLVFMFKNIKKGAAHQEGCGKKYRFSNRLNISAEVLMSPLSDSFQNLSCA